MRDLTSYLHFIGRDQLEWKLVAGSSAQQCFKDEVEPRVATDHQIDRYETCVLLASTVNGTVRVGSEMGHTSVLTTECVHCICSILNAGDSFLLP